MPDNIKEYTGCILAGGLGTRLRSCINDRPKVLAPVAGRPFLDYLLTQFSSSGIERCILCTGYLAKQIENTYGNSFSKMELIFSSENTPLGTGGALKNASKHIKSPKLIVANGDSFFGINLTKAIESFNLYNYPAMIMLKNVSNAARYGRVELDHNNFITSFNEKDGKETPGIINAGVYILKRKLINNIEVNKKISLEHQVFPKLVKSKQIIGYPEKGIFIDIGTPESYKLAQTLTDSFKTEIDYSNKN